MKTLSHLLVASRAICALAFCLLAAGLGLYVFDEDTKGSRPKLVKH